MKEEVWLRQGSAVLCRAVPWSQIRSSCTHLERFKRLPLLLHVLFHVAVVPDDHLFRLESCREEVVEVPRAMGIYDV